MSRRAREDDGLTLVELLVAVAIMGVAFTIVVGGIFTYVQSSINHRSQATVQLELRKYVTALQGLAYSSCATSYAPAYTAPTGIGTPTQSVMLWNATANDFTTTPAVGCADPGLQRIRVTMTFNDGDPTHTYSESVDVVKRS